MKKSTFHKLELWLHYFGGIIIAILLFFIFFNKDIKTKNFDKGYKQGQIDALNGIQNYDKIVMKDTVYINWKEIEETNFKIK